MDTHVLSSGILWIPACAGITEGDGNNKGAQRGEAVTTVRTRERFLSTNF